MPGVERPRITSDEDYGRRLGDLATWEPLARTALAQAGIAQPAYLRVAYPLGTYPTLLADTGPRLVVKLFGDRYHGPQSHAAEHAAYQVLAGHDLPVPRLVAAGDLFPDDPAWPWPFLIVTELPGRRYANLTAHLDPAQRVTIARALGRLLRRLHSLPLPPARPSGPLASSWDRFLALLHRRRREVAADQRRWGVLPARLCDQLDGWLPNPATLVDSSKPPVFVHGDLHDEHVFVNPDSATLTGVIDFTDAYAGDPRYDLVALHCNTFRLDTTLLAACLDAYGWEHDAADWPREMLAFTLLHDFNMFRADMRLERFASLDELGRTIWDPS